MIANLQRTLKGIPLIGGPLATMAGFLPYAAFGAIGVELPIQGSAMIMAQEWVPQALKDSQSTYFAVVGTFTALLVSQFLPGSAQMKKEAAIAIASGSYGAAYFIWRQKQLANAAGIATPEQIAAGGEEGTSGLGALVMSSKGGGYGALTVGGQSLGMGPAYTVGPQGYGAVVVGG